MKCMTCGRRPRDGVWIYRQNPTVRPELYACAQHTSTAIDPVIAALIQCFEGGGADDENWDGGLAPRRPDRAGSRRRAGR